MTGLSPVSIPLPRSAPDAVEHRIDRPHPGTRPAWHLYVDDTEVTAVTARGTVGTAHISEHDDQVVVELWTEQTDVPAGLTDQLVDRAFSLPAVTAHRPVLVCVPRHNGEAVVQARRHVQDPSTRAAGVTCLIEGRVDDGTPPRREPGRRAR